MRIFQSLRERLGITRNRREEPLFGLSAEQIESLREWRQSAAFDAYLLLLDSAITLYADSVLACREDAVLHETRGILLGLRKAAGLVDEALQHAQELAERDTRDREQHRFAGDPRIVALYGSPAYGRGASGA